MRTSFTCRLRVTILILTLVVGAGFVSSVWGNPSEYPEFARQIIDENIPIQFIKAISVKQRLDHGVPQLIVDVRRRSRYEIAHLPGAISAPLRTLSASVSKLPRDKALVLY